MNIQCARVRKNKSANKVGVISGQPPDTTVPQLLQHVFYNNIVLVMMYV